MNKPTVNLFYDTRTIKKGNKYPVKLTIYYNGKKKRYGIGIDLAPDEWKKINGGKLKDEKLKEVRNKLNELVSISTNYIDKTSFFTFPKFKKSLFTDMERSDKIFEYYNAKIKRLNETGRPGTADSYIGSMKSIQEFCETENLTFSEITPEFLTAYERWMVGNEKSSTTVGIYLRCTRSLFKEYINGDSIKNEIYPFGKGKYNIPSGINIKKALKLSELEKIFNYEAPDGSTEQKALDYWTFSYLCNGINIADIARLKYKNIGNNEILLSRKKSINTKKKNTKQISIVLTDRAKIIIERWGNKPVDSNAYIFQILYPGIKPRQELAAVKQATKTINKYMKIVAGKLGIDQNVTTYTARHSYATVLKRSGASLEFISESFGHSDLKVTENYLDSFEKEERVKWASKLTDFTNNHKNEEK